VRETVTIIGGDMSIAEEIIRSELSHWKQRLKNETETEEKLLQQLENTKVSLAQIKKNINELEGDLAKIT
jgi:hypothetical protein